MKATIHIGGRDYTADLNTGHSIAIPLQFDGPQPNSYGVPAATSIAYEDGTFVGDTRRGGSCNFETVSLTPHCNGTHTECLGHITDERISVEAIIPAGLKPATLITVSPEEALLSPESYFLVKEEQDRIISARMLRDALENADPDFLEALVIRTAPNDVQKCRRQYTEQPAPFFSAEAMQLVLEYKVQHLLVDIPSLDRAFDNGQLSTHHLFWNLAQGSHADAPDAHRGKSVTEFIYVPDYIPDGQYLLDLQIAPFVLDAAPSRPVLFSVSDHQPHDV
ncbi:MAG: hypothetical protein C0600_13420 [Ignavibacteria bacterium]|nr:MAG: hypothetical protein C0600_13420 [Ignavibacteria bacterium]